MCIKLMSFGVSALKLAVTLAARDATTDPSAEAKPLSVGMEHLLTTAASSSAGGALQPAKQ